MTLAEFMTPAEGNLLAASLAAIADNMKTIQILGGVGPAAAPPPPLVPAAGGDAAAAMLMAAEVQVCRLWETKYCYLGMALFSPSYFTVLLFSQPPPFHNRMTCNFSMRQQGPELGRHFSFPSIEACPLSYCPISTSLQESNNNMPIIVILGVDRGCGPGYGLMRVWIRAWIEGVDQGMV